MTAESLTKIADSTTVLVLSRLSMMAIVPMALIIIWFGRDYLDTKFEVQNATLAAAITRVANVELALKENVDAIDAAGSKIAGIDTRTSSIEAARVEARRAADDRSDAVLNQLAQQQAAIMDLSVKVSALTAVMQQGAGR